MPNRGTTAPIWQTILIVGAIQLVVGILLMVVGGVAQNSVILSGGGDIVIVGAITAVVGVVLSWVRVSA